MVEKVYCARCSDYHVPGPPCTDMPEFQCCICRKFCPADMETFLEIDDKSGKGIKSVCSQSTCIYELYYSQERRIAALEKALKIAEKEIESQMAWWGSLPMGIDYEADIDNTSPDDAVAFIGGIAYRSARKTLVAIREAREGSDDL